MNALPHRTITFLAVGLLLLDGLLLIMAGVWTQRSGLALAGGGLVILAGVLVLWWRRYLRQIEELRLTQQALRNEVEGIRRVLRGEE